MTLVDRLLTLDYIMFSIPFFVVMILVESAIVRWKKLDYYEFNDSIGSLSTGVLQTLLMALVPASSYLVYQWLYERAAFFDLRQSSELAKWLIFAFGLLAVDCLYYWAHRFSHEINFMWGGHGVHHQSEYFNLSTALRQGAFQPLLTWPLYLPLALIGLPPLWFLSLNALMTVMQFWFHTRLIRRMGWLEVFLNTPSHHRVHHAINGKYLDKNYAGIFIIWDKMFGTFIEEDIEPVYGTVKPLRSFNPVWANFEHYAGLRALISKVTSVNKWLYLFKAPGWDALKGNFFRQQAFADHQPRQVIYRLSTDNKSRVLAICRFSLLLVLSLLFLLFSAQWPRGAQLFIFSYLVFSFWCLGRYLDQQKSHRILEILNLFGLAAATVIIAWQMAI